MNRGLMVSGEFPCVRAGKLTEALSHRGWEHDALARKFPPQLSDSYRSVTALMCATQEQLGEAIARSDAALVHVHNEPNWPVVVAKAYSDKPVILNVHDVTSARPHGPYDPWEAQAYQDADAFVFVSEWQRDFCIEQGFAVEGKPYAVIGNYASASTIVERSYLPHIGGVCYAGGLDKRGSDVAWRDLSPVADALGGQLHIYPGGPGIDYGILHPTVLDYRMLTHRLAQHDWGFTGTPVPNDAWHHSLPNKAFEYLAAGIPLIAMNNPLLMPLCEEGLGVYVEDLKALPAILRDVDVKAYKKRVKAARHRFTMEHHIQPVLDLYGALT